jgi:predicted amidophosphoribosyltransferase
MRADCRSAPRSRHTTLATIACEMPSSSARRASAPRASLVGGALRTTLAQLRALVVPPACAACGAPLGPADEVLCPACRAALPWLREARCPRCALPAPCRPCPAARAAYAASWAPLAHEGVARQVVSALKFHGGLAVADAMAAQIAAGAPPGLLRGATLIPVPAAPARRRRRGYDHAEVLARALAGRAGLPVEHVLERASGPRQLGAGRAQRLAGGRLVVASRGRAPPRVALVDDVHTTGATLDACARALREAGARDVVAVTYTRALRR